MNLHMGTCVRFGANFAKPERTVRDCLEVICFPTSAYQSNVMTNLVPKPHKRTRSVRVAEIGPVSLPAWLWDWE